MENISLNELQSAILSLIYQNCQITITELSGILNINNSAVQRNIEYMKDAGILIREGGRFGGKWIIMNTTDSQNMNINHLIK